MHMYVYASCVSNDFKQENRHVHVCRSTCFLYTSINTNILLEKGCNAQRHRSSH